MAGKADIKTILQYSAKKKNTKIIPLCSVKNPATNSDSASGRSKGVRLVSANAEMKKMMNIGSNGTMYQIACWFSMIVIILNDPVNRITVRMAELRISSYEII